MVPRWSVTFATSNGRASGPVTMARMSGMASQVSALLMVSRIASAGSSQPIVMPQVNVDGMPETCSGLNTSTGPSRARYPAVAV